MSAFPSLVVLWTTDQFDILRIEQTRVENYNIHTNDLIKELLSIDQKHGIDILAADAGSVEFRLKRIPMGQEETEFRHWLQEFAPDSDTPNTLDEPIKLWWD